MRIEDESAKDATARRTDTIKQMQALMEQQDQLARSDAADKRVDGGGAPSQPSEGIDGAPNAAQLAREAHAIDEHRRVEAQDLRVRQDALGAQQLAQSIENELSGAELHDKAVGAASGQQARGEAWMNFREQEQGNLPPSVEEIAEQEKQSAADQQQQQERISVQALMNQHKINNGIPG